MKVPVYSMRDAKVGFQNLYIDTNDQTAIRGFGYAIKHSNPMMGEYPQDYDLFRVGQFDIDSGLFEPLAVPELLVSGLSCVRGDKNEDA